MKALIILLLLSGVAKAQTYDEFFRQRKTQRKYLIQQLAALKMYAGYLKKGYDITNKGIQTIKEFTNGEFNLHGNFFKSLKSINPSAIDKSKILEIAALQISINRNFNSMNRDDSLPESYRRHISNVKRSVLTDCSTTMDELFLIITSEKLELRDNERVKRLDVIYRRMIENYQFASSFLGEVKLLSNQSRQEKADNNLVIKMYESIK